VATVSTQRVANSVSQGVGLWQSGIVETEPLSAFSVFAVLSGTFIGDFYIEATNVRGDDAIDNWWLITSSYQALTNTTEILMDASVFAYSAIRICSTITSGTATITIDVSRKIR
jgi:hypothetical protein